MAAVVSSLLELWRFAMVAQHNAWRNRYMPDVDPNRFVHEPAPVWMERQGLTYRPTKMEWHLWLAASAGDRTLVEKLEAHHGVHIHDAAVEEAVRLSARYLPERQLPDKAVSVLDTAAARVAMGRAVVHLAPDIVRSREREFQHAL